MKARLIIPWFIPHAGCPHTCRFCNQHQVSGEGEGIPSDSQLTEGIRQWLTHSPRRPAEVAFYGGSFTLLPRAEQSRLIETARHFNTDGVTGIRISTRPDAVSDEICQFLRQAGVTTVELGVQSLSDHVLRASGRGHMAQDSLQALARLASYGFSVGAQLLPGLPGDSLDQARASLKGVVGAGATFVRIYPALVLSGTALAEDYLRGNYQPLTLNQAVDWCAALHAEADTLAVPVIRTGLQDEPSISGSSTVLAGPWHPSFGALVQAARWRYLLESILEGFRDTDVTIIGAQRLQSVLIGHAGSTRKQLEAAGLRVVFTVDTQNELSDREICIRTPSETFFADLGRYPYPGGSISI